MLGTTFTLIAVFFLFVLICICVSENKADKLLSALSNDAIECREYPSRELTDNSCLDNPAMHKAPITVDFEKLKKANPDIIAWLYCENTEINYPVVQSRDNDYYLRRSIDYSWALAGTIFLDFRNRNDFSDSYSILYGHNMRNGTMFGSLPYYKEQKYFEAHPVWYLLTPEQNYAVELCAGNVVSYDSNVFSYDYSEISINDVVSDMCMQSFFKTDTKIDPHDRMIAFSTCSYEYDGARFVLTGILREIK